MNKVIITIIGIIIVGGIIFYAFKSPKETVAPSITPSDTMEMQATTTPVIATTTITVTYTDKGFSPKDISINVGDVVRFVSSTTLPMWVASDAHPTHKEYDGTDLKTHCAKPNDTTFDQCTKGKEFSFTFTKTGTWEYHNHAKATDTGTITVK